MSSPVPSPRAPSPNREIVEKIPFDQKEQSVRLAAAKVQRATCFFFESLCIVAAGLSSAAWVLGKIHPLALLALFAICAIVGSIIEERREEIYDPDEARFLGFEELKKKYTWQELGLLVPQQDLQQKCQSYTWHHFDQMTKSSGSKSLEYFHRGLITPKQLHYLMMENKTGYERTLNMV